MKYVSMCIRWRPRDHSCSLCTSLCRLVRMQKTRRIGAHAQTLRGLPCTCTRGMRRARCRLQRARLETAGLLAASSSAESRKIVVLHAAGAAICHGLLMARCRRRSCRRSLRSVLGGCGAGVEHMPVGLPDADGAVLGPGAVRAAVRRKSHAVHWTVVTCAMAGRMLLARCR